MKITELIVESNFILESDSYCKKCIFEIDGIKIKTTITLINSEEANLIDGFSERYHKGEWKHLYDSLPKKVSIENLKKIQEDLVENSAIILFGKKTELTDVERNNYLIFQWKDIEPDQEKVDNDDSDDDQIIRIDFKNRKK